LQSPANNAGKRIVTDMAGRQIEVPAQIHKVLAMSPMGTTLIYTLDPSLLLGWNYQSDPGERAMLLEAYRNLPVLGGWFGKDNTGNLEKIMQAHPDVLISMGDPLGTAQAERVQGQTHIPVIILDGRLEHLPETYVKAGELFGSAPRAAQLASECRRTLDEIKQKISGIPQNKRRRYYYAEGPKGLETEPGGSMHSEALNFAGGINVAAGVELQQGYGHSAVSMEQVLGWNPEIVISGYDHSSTPGEFYKTVWTDSAWKIVSAVRNRDVYETPQYPFNWIDRPPSVNRIIGVKWLANLFYPSLFPYDMRNETRKFYKLFYQLDLSDAQLDQLLSTALRSSANKTK
jgi:iron complex transport system substrate-binding protein